MTFFTFLLQRRLTAPAALGALLGTLIFSPQGAFAETTADVVNCFDYYRFGSVQVDIQAQSPTVVTGVPMVFTGTIANTNEYPIVDGAVSVKIFRVDPLAEKNTAGPEVVAAFTVKKDMALPAHGEAPLEFTWDVPSYAVSGDYRLATYFTVADKFNLLGLTFTDDVVGNIADFSILGEQTGGVNFEKATVTINDNPYHFAAYPPQVEHEQAVSIQASLINSTEQSQTVPVTWRLYAWDAQRAENIVTSEEQLVTVAPKSSSPSTFIASDTAHPVYYAVATARYQDTASILGVRFVRRGVAQTRLNFPSLTDFPLRAGQETSIFSCLHGMGPDDVVPGGKLVLSLTDSNGGVFHTATYEGDVTGAMMGVRDTFVPDQDYRHLTLQAKLYQDSHLIDDVSMNYDCTTLSPEDCPPEPGAVGAATPDNTSPSRAWQIGLGILSLAVVVGFLAYARTKRRSIGVLALIAFSSIFLASPVDAKSTQLSQTISGQLAEAPSLGGLRGQRFGLIDPTVTITYLADILNLDTNTILSDNATIPVGTHLLLRFKPHVYEHITWFGTGYAFDTPYGDWVAEAKAPTPVLPGDHPMRPRNTCNPKDFLQRLIEFSNGSFDAYVPLAVNPPVKTLTDLSHLDCGTLSPEGHMLCTVTSPGTVTAKFNFAPTYGTFYYRLLERLAGAAACYGGNAPLYKEDTPFTLRVPATSIPFTFTAQGAETTRRPPATPVIAGPTTGLINDTQAFTVTGTDPDGAQLQYGLDWTGDGVVDQWLPGPPQLVTSGTPQPFTRIWSVVGPKTFRAKARNTFGLESGWATHTITLSEAVATPTPTPTPSPTVSATPVPVADIMSWCNPHKQTVYAGLVASFDSPAATAFEWLAPGGTPTTGASSTRFSTRYQNPGLYTVSVQPPYYYDVTGDGFITEADADGVSSNLGSTGAPGSGSLWQNQVNRFDVNTDGTVSPQDRVIIVNYLNSQGASQLPSLQCMVEVVPVLPTPSVSPTPSGGPFNPGPIRETE